MSDNLVKVTFISQGETVFVLKGINLLKAAKIGGMEVDALCGGKGTCGKCRGKLIEGQLSEAGSNERKLLSSADLDNGIVLLCQRTIEGNVTVETKPGIALKSISMSNFMPGKGEHDVKLNEVKPIIKKRFHQLSPPTAQEHVADLDRILKGLPKETTFDMNLLPLIPKILKKADYQITTTFYGDELIAIEAGNTVSELFGIAIDVGTTSVAGYLINMNTGEVIASASAANRQRMHGADVISRIEYTVKEGDGLNEMKGLVVQTIDEIVEKLLAASEVSSDRVYLVTLIGNTVMSHLLMGVSPRGLASSPFIPVFSKGMVGRLSYLGLKSLPTNSRFILLPNVSGYVGSDTVGVILSTKINELSGNWLAIDIGTNGEVVLSAEGRIITCSTAAGPAFEGATISQGMRAEPGAIYKVKIEDDVYVSVVSDSEPRGICGSGLVDAVSQLLKLGVIRGNGRFKQPSECLETVPEKIRRRIVDTGKGAKFILTEGPQEVAITQKDISELQLGKAAIRAGIDVILDKAGVKHLNGILLAGAFGSNLRVESLIGLGMLPEVEVDRIKAIGNAAGVGAIMALLSEEELKIALDLPKAIEHIELSLYKGFQRNFARALRF